MLNLFNWLTLIYIVYDRNDVEKSDPVAAAPTAPPTTDCVTPAVARRAKPPATTGKLTEKKKYIIYI